MALARRLFVLVRCIQNVFRILPPDSETIPSDDDRQDATINLQAFVFNIHGCLDNLAWLWVHETNQKRKNGKDFAPGQVGLGKKNEEIRSTLPTDLRQSLTDFDEWYVRYQKNYRDALAHRIPLYVIPHFTKESDADAYKDFERQKREAIRNGTTEQHDQIERRQLEFATFKPMMRHSFGESDLIVFHYAMLADFGTVEDLTWKFLGALRNFAPSSEN